jgi:hypothetical protein
MHHQDPSGPRQYISRTRKRTGGTGARRTLKGRQAHGRSERVLAGNGEEATTDSPAEQSLEAGKNGEEATAAVMQCGC